MDVDFSARLVIVQFDPDETDADAIVGRIPPKRFEASRRGPVALIVEDAALRMRAVAHPTDDVEVGGVKVRRSRTEARGFAGGEAGTIQVRIAPRGKNEPRDVALVWRSPWSDSSGKAAVDLSDGEGLETIAVTAPAEPPERGAVTSIQLQYRLESDGEGASPRALELTYRLPMLDVEEGKKPGSKAGK